MASTIIAKAIHPQIIWRIIANMPNSSFTVRHIIAVIVDIRKMKKSSRDLPRKSRCHSQSSIAFIFSFICS